MPYRRGAPRGNQNRLIHGRFSKMVAERRVAVRIRLRTVRALIARVNIVSRLREALRGKKLRERAIPTTFKWRKTVIRTPGKMPRFRALTLEEPGPLATLQAPRRNNIDDFPIIKLLLLWLPKIRAEEAERA